MSQPYNLGSQFYFLAWGQNLPNRFKNTNAFRSQIGFLGTGETAGDDEERPEFEPVMNDVSGRIPTDLCFEGVMSFVAVDLTRWNESVVRAAQARPWNSGSFRGTYTVSQLGALLVHEGLAPSLIVLNSRRDEPANNNGANAAPRGKRYFCAVPVGPDVRRGGSKANKLRMVFQCLPIYDEAAQAHRLYDENVQSVEGINLASIPNIR